MARPITERLDDLAVALTPARRAASEARARANLAPWPIAWALGLWAWLLGLRVAFLQARAKRLRADLQTTMEDLAAGHRPHRSRAYRDAQRRKSTHGHL